MYLKLFGFTEKPFHITPNPRFIFLSKNHKEAFAHLLYGIQQRVGFLSLTGEVGTGKTTVLRTLLGQLDDSEYSVALVFNPCLTVHELLQTIHKEYGIAESRDQTSLVALHESLNNFLLQQREKGRTVVLVIDEAQNLDTQVLEQLRLLSNLETETEKLIQIVLVGQPELDDLLKQKNLRQLRQRLAIRYQLKPLDIEDSARYVQHRARVAGWQEGPLFSGKALSLIYRYTGGTPRLINILCDRALLVAYNRDSRNVSQQDIKVAQTELNQQEPQQPRRLLPALIVILLILLGAFTASQLSLTAPDSMGEALQLNKEAVAPAAEASTPVAETIAPPQEPVIASLPAMQSEPNPTVVEPQVAQPVPQSIIVEPPPAPPEPVPLSTQQITELHQSMAAYSAEKSALQALISVSALWDTPIPEMLPTVRNSRNMKATLRQLKFECVDFKGTLDELLYMGAPAILEIVLPSISGQRFLGLLEATDTQVRVAPALSDDGWLDKSALAEVWFGNALIPFENNLQIGFINHPRQAGIGVEFLQGLLGVADQSLQLDSAVYDQQTIDAVTRFQREHQLAPDGRVGSQTLFWLYKEAGLRMPRLVGVDL